MATGPRSARPRLEVTTPPGTRSERHLSRSSLSAESACDSTRTMRRRRCGASPLPVLPHSRTDSLVFSAGGHRRRDQDGHPTSGRAVPGQLQGVHSACPRRLGTQEHGATVRQAGPCRHCHQPARVGEQHGHPSDRDCRRWGPSSCRPIGQVGPVRRPDAQRRESLQDQGDPKVRRTDSFFLPDSH